MSGIGTKIVVTTSRKGIPGSEIAALVAETGWEYVSRDEQSIAALARNNAAEGVVVWEAGGPVLYLGTNKFFFHPNMAKNRLAQHRKGRLTDIMARVLGVRAGDEFLDCTLGLGADAITASYLVGETGRVVGLESSPIVAPLVKWGMAYYETSLDWLQEAIRRIEVVQTEHLSFLSQQATGSFDIVYFDPMFREPVPTSQALAPLRTIANTHPLQRETIREAVRTARRRVVVKERRGSPEFERLGIHTVVGGESSRVAYGVIAVDKL